MTTHASENKPKDAHKDDPQELIGVTLDDRYFIEEVIGQGGMGIVYKAFNTRFQRDTAVKVLSSSWSTESDAIKRFIREAQAAFEMNHPNLVNVYDLGLVTDKRPYFAMELCKGRPLSRVLEEQSRLDIGHTVDFIQQAATALDAIHKLKIYHRDIKPENLMVVEDEEGKERIKLLDFGIAAFAGEYLGATQLTRTGQMQGTPQYLAPETAQGSRPDARSDVYSLAVVTFELLASVIPFAANNSVTTLTKKCNEPPPFLSEIIGVSVPASIEGVLQKGLATLPEDRYNTAGEFASDLMMAVHRDADQIPASLLTVKLSKKPNADDSLNIEKKREALPTMFNARELAEELAALKEQGKLHPPQKRALPFPVTTVKTPSGQDHTPRSGKTIPLDLARPSSIPPSLDLPREEQATIELKPTPRASKKSATPHAGAVPITPHTQNNTANHNDVKSTPLKGSPNTPPSTTPTPLNKSHSDLLNSLRKNRKKKAEASATHLQSQSSEAAAQPSSSSNAHLLPKGSLLSNVPNLDLKAPQSENQHNETHASVHPTDSFERKVFGPKVSLIKSLIIGALISASLGGAFIFLTSKNGHSKPSSTVKPATTAKQADPAQHLSAAQLAREQSSKNIPPEESNPEEAQPSKVPLPSISNLNPIEQPPTNPSKHASQKTSPAPSNSKLKQQSPISKTPTPKAQPSTVQTSTRQTSQIQPLKAPHAQTSTPNNKSAPAPVQPTTSPSPKTLSDAENFRLGKKYYLEGNYKKSIVHFRQVTKKTPKNDEAWYQLARAYQATGQKRAAMNAYNRVLMVAPKGLRAKKSRQNIDALKKWFIRAPD